MSPDKENGRRHDGFASAVAFGGRLDQVEEHPDHEKGEKHPPNVKVDARPKVRLVPPISLFVPNASCALSTGGGRSRSLVNQPAHVDIGGVSFVTLARADTEAFQMEDHHRIEIHARARIEGLSVGTARRFSHELCEVELVSWLDAEESHFEFRKRVIDRPDFAGRRYAVEFWDVPATHDELINQLSTEQGQRRVIGPTPKIGTNCQEWEKFLRQQPVIRFHTVSRLEPLTGPDLAPPDETARDYARYLPDLGGVFFGEMVASTKARSFSSIRFAFGSHYGGGGGCGDVESRPKL